MYSLENLTKCTCYSRVIDIAVFSECMAFSRLRSTLGIWLYSASVWASCVVRDCLLGADDVQLVNLVLRV